MYLNLPQLITSNWVRFWKFTTWMEPFHTTHSSGRSHNLSSFRLERLNVASNKQSPKLVIVKLSIFADLPLNSGIIFMLSSCLVSVIPVNSNFCKHIYHFFINSIFNFIFEKKKDFINTEQEKAKPQKAYGWNRGEPDTWSTNKGRRMECIQPHNRAPKNHIKAI